MALTVKQLNDNSSFLLSFEPISPHPTSGVGSEPFTILLDPWITGPPTVFYSHFSVAVHREQTCIETLRELPAPPDLVIISQPKSDHCSEDSLKQMPQRGTKTIILAEAAAAKIIRGWRYFDSDKVRTLQRWENPRKSGKQTTFRVTVPPHSTGGEPGEVTIALIPQKRDLRGIHSAIAITYRPPPTRHRSFRSVLTPTVTPRARGGSAGSPLQPISQSSPTLPQISGLLSVPPTTPASPGGRSLRSVRSIASLSPYAHDRAVSVIFAPHGISYRSLEPYATSHLVAEASLPLTALLHCFDSISSPWWLGGSVYSGTPAGQETASALCARVWISVHDRNVEVRGVASRILRTRRYRPADVAGVLDGLGKDTCQGEETGPLRSRARTEVLVLGSGEEIILTSEGLWNAELISDTIAASIPESAVPMANMAQVPL